MSRDFERHFLTFSPVLTRLIAESDPSVVSPALTRSGKNSIIRRSVTGHDFCRAAKCPKFSEGVTGCGKIRYVARSVTGHDFSRAADASIQ
jgi:hypothetical protein